ncbi:hypothetical protein DVU_2718 [Nitratidesulfovibrio vulgaris str. Hildenborough]|uniref:Uncharacterized protein n=1 Tax=Nitratidesulfovibrio vulgaris (strain ATCC 29579 / DSM 644 / CCUG 34227 / NCIMB 8303 / VKM B-1760 / Hildenborough) TaxID=882 RepID=Q727Y6_NITV2|nr:hypothetical protein DVU_2718 [Nitratidesulfovibrio vulgaris str. Hildenborough]
MNKAIHLESKPRHCGAYLLYTELLPYRVTLYSNIPYSDINNVTGRSMPWP